MILTARLTVTNVINVNNIEFAPIGESTGAIPQVRILNSLFEVDIKARINLYLARKEPRKDISKV